MWRQHAIDDWNEFQNKKNTPLTATPRVRPQGLVDQQKRMEYSLQIPSRSCPPNTPAEIPAVIPVPVVLSKGKAKGKRAKASSAQVAPPWHQGAQPSTSVSGRGYQHPDPQAWNYGSYWRR